jgi:hypothetical protein
VTYPRVKAEILNNHFANIYTVDETNVPGKHDVAPLAVDRLDNIIICEQDVNDQLQILNINRPPGPDGLTPRIIKSQQTELLKPLTNIFNRSMREHSMPFPFIVEDG